MSTLKLGIVGAGFVAHFHAQALKQVRNIEVVGIYALQNAESLSAYVKKNHLGEGVIYPDVGELAKHVEAIAIYGNARGTGKLDREERYLDIGI